MQRVLPYFLCAFGLLWVFWPTWTSGFHQMQTDPGDTRLNQYILEHSWAWLKGDTRGFWNPGYFYPAENVAAFTENLLGVAPLYWVFRVFTSHSDLAFQLWMIVIFALNFGAGFWLFRRAWGFQVGPACVAAFLIAFASSRVAQLGHQQLMPWFFMLLSLGMGWRFLQGRRPRIGLLGFFGFLVLQAYAGIYTTWFYVFILFWILIAALVFSESRSLLWNRAKIHWRLLLLTSSLSLVAISPLAVHYLEAKGQIGAWGFDAVFWLLPSWQAWIYHGDESWMYSWQKMLKIFRVIPISHEKQLGFGWITLVVAFVGWWRVRSSVWWKPVFLGMGFIWFSVSTFPGEVHIWELFYNFFPGAEGIRAMGRIGMFFLIPAAFGVAVFLQSPRRLMLTVVFAMLVVLEQGRAMKGFDRNFYRDRDQALAEKISSDCTAFFYAPSASSLVGSRISLNQYDLQREAMFAGLQSGVPTVNGYSSKPPGGWALSNSIVRSESDRDRLEMAMSAWSARGPFEVCWID